MKQVSFNSLWEIATNCILAIFWGCFLWLHLRQFLLSGAPVMALMVIAESLLVMMYLTRSSALRVSTNPIDWALGFFGTFPPLLLRPSEAALAPEIASWIMLVGVALQIWGIAFLNRSFAIVAAQRVIKTKGPYAFVRHPIYLAYFLIYPAYFLGSTSLWNGIILILAIGITLLRALREENLLLNSSEYQSYAARVRWRMLPGIF